MTASILVDPSFDLASIAEEAGNGAFDSRWYQDGYLYVEGVSQEALEAAFAAYDHEEARSLVLRSTAFSLNNAAYESAIAVMTSGYPASEISTWEVQRQEAAAWDFDSQSPTPWIDGAAAARGIDRVEYLTRTLAKAQAFAQASAWLTGRRQGYEDLIKITAPEQLDALEFDYSLPGAP